MTPMTWLYWHEQSQCCRRSPVGTLPQRQCRCTVLDAVGTPCESVRITWHDMSRAWPEHPGEVSYPDKHYGLRRVTSDLSHQLASLLGNFSCLEHAARRDDNFETRHYYPSVRPQLYGLWRRKFCTSSYTIFPSSSGGGLKSGGMGLKSTISFSFTANTESFFK